MSTDLLKRLRSALTDRYAVESEIGRGGMAVVFLAEDSKHSRKVAIKVLHPELAASVGPERFLGEIETVAGLSHPHILPLHDSGEAVGLLYYVMPYVEGESLSDRLERHGQLPLDEAIQIAREVADGLDYAHERGVVHRDIKPGNILLSRGHALIADFGIAKAVGAAGEGDRSATATGLTIGTPRYMSPEQATGVADVDGRSDVYALGCVLWEMLAGKPPFDGPTPHVILARKATETPPQVRALRTSVVPALDRVLAKALTTSPEDRFQTAGEMAAALAAPETVGRVRRRSRREWGTAAAVVAIMAVGAGLWSLASRGFFGSAHEDPAVMALDSTKIAVLPFQVIGVDSTSPARNLASEIGGLLEIKVVQEFGRTIAHPGSVEERWRQAGGSFGGRVSEETELEIGRSVGAGALIRGSLVEADGELTVAASMVDVATGEIRVPTVRRRGPIGNAYDLVDELVVVLLSTDWGYPEGGIPRLATYEPEAIQAYLAALAAPFESDEEDEFFDAALEADSSLVEAALQKYASGQQDRAALRYAWERRDRLSEKGRAYIEVLAEGRFGSTTSMADVIVLYDSLTRRWPEWAGARRELGEKLTLSGALASIPDWRRRAREVLESIERPASNQLWVMSELAFIDADTARARVLADRLVAVAKPPDWLAEVAPTYHWRLAVLQGDTAGAARAASTIQDSTWILTSALADGRGAAYADRVAETGAADFWAWPDSWWWARGRDPEWREAWQQSAPRRVRPFNPETVLDPYTVPVWRAILLGPSEDSAAVEPIRRLEALASGADERSVTTDTRILARCWVTLWNLLHGDANGARATLASMAESELPHRFAAWEGLVEVLLARLEGGDVHSALLHADSVAGTMPLPRTGSEIQNLLLSRLLREYGEPVRALGAVRRRTYASPWIVSYTSIPEYLREEARLAVEIGDTTGAREAYRHYFALRDSRPDHPTWATQWDSMRVEYAGLTGVETP